MPEVRTENAEKDEMRDALQSAVSCYLASLIATANCVGTACPAVGGLYRHRLSRLRARVAFDSSPEMIEESCAAVESDLKEYAAKASAYLAQHGTELRSAITALEAIVRSFAQREDFYAARLRQFAAQMESTAYPTDPEHLREVVDLQAAGLQSCVESMSHETQSMLARMREELAAVERRLHESEVTDPLTGLMNRREMERQIEMKKAAGTPPVLLRFELTGEVGAEVLQQVGSRLGSQFRHKDMVARWSDTEFMVLFQASQEIAHMRADQIVPWIAGRYLLDSGETMEIGVEVHFEQFELVA